MLADADVLAAMRHAFLETETPLPERTMAALDAGQAAGGDRSGQQSAALVVEQLGAAERSREGIDRMDGTGVVARVRLSRVVVDAHAPGRL